MQAALISISSTLSATNVLLANRLEVQTHWPTEAVSLSLLGENTQTLLRKWVNNPPRVVAIYCTIYNILAAQDLATRIRSLYPTTKIILGGPEALAAKQLADQIVATNPLPALKKMLGAKSSAKEKKISDAEIIKRHEQRLAQLVQQTALGEKPALLEPQWEGELPPACAGVYAATANKKSTLNLLHSEGARALFTSAVPLELRISFAEAIKINFHAAAPRLLYLPAQIIDEKSLKQLKQCGIKELCLLFDPTLKFDNLRPLIEQAQDAGFALGASMAIGCPAHSFAQLQTTLEQILRLGLDDISLPHYSVPLSSSYRGRAAKIKLNFSAQAPYEVISHEQLSAPELLKLDSYESTLKLLAPTISGTGLLRVLATQYSGLELLENFAQSHSQLFTKIPGSTEITRAWFEFLRRQYGLELSAEMTGPALARAPQLIVRWLADGQRLVVDDATGTVAHLGKHALLALDQFDAPASLAQICTQLAAAAPSSQRRQMQLDLQKTLRKLADMGFLLPPQQIVESAAKEGESAFTSLEEFDYHYRMLADVDRVQAYRAAIKKVVKPGMHVVEIGTGTGILALLAAQAGARVTAIERFATVHLAREVALRNGLAEKITFIRGRSDLIELSERGDVLLSEIVGNRILNEGILETTIDARRRLLNPRGLLIPKQIEIFAQLGCTSRFLDLKQEFEKLGKPCGVDLSPIAAWISKRLLGGNVVWELGHDDERFEPLSDEKRAALLDLSQIEQADFSLSTRVTAQPGTINAVLLAFRLQLQPGIELSTRGHDHGLHWCKPVYMLAQPIKVTKSLPLLLTLRYQTHGEIAVTLTQADEVD